MSSFYSSSSSFIPDYGETALLDQIAQIASQLGQQQYSWAQQQFANTSALTDQAVQQYLSAANASDQLAQNNINRYEQVYQPLEDQLIQDANSYASQPRIAFEMGKAESGAGQAMDANRLNAERELQSFGIDPSSGRYAELEMAQNAQRGAAQAGAAQQAQYNTENVGRQLRSQAIQVGQQYPGQAVNALNSEVQGLSGAVNAKLANLNAGTAALASADPFLNTAMALKYPPLGNRSQSQSGSGFRVQSGNGSNGGGASRFGGGGGGTAGYPGNINGPAAGYYGSTTPGYGSYQPNAGIMDIPGGYDTGGNFGGSPYDTYGQDYGSYTNYDPNGYSQFADPTAYGGASYDPFNTYGQDYGAYTNYGYGNDTSSYGGDYGSSDYSGGYNSGGQDFGSYGDTSYSSDPTAGFSNYDSGGFGDSFAAGGAVDPFGGYYTGTVTEPVVGSNPAAPPQQSSTPVNEPVMGSTPGQTPNYSVNPVSEPFIGQFSQPSGGISSGRGSGSRLPSQPISLASGGNPTTGGFVPKQASPSGGRLQDDVPANLNEGEFVVPRDVAMWKGQEFFQKLIDQSRKARMGASAQGKPGPRAPGPTRFNSQAMPQPTSQPQMGAM